MGRPSQERPLRQRVLLRPQQRLRRNCVRFFVDNVVFVVVVFVDVIFVDVVNDFITIVGFVDFVIFDVLPMLLLLLLLLMC
jgi:hypothetical protein